MKGLITLAIVSLVPWQAGAQDSTHRSASVGSGQQIRLNAYMNINRDCSAGAPPEVRVITPPRNGSLSIRSGRGRSPRAGKCENVDAPVRLVVYQSNRGFIGDDQVVYEVKKADGATEAQSVTITVTPPTATSPTRKNESEKIDL
jgi:hypothetical protein